jgi:PAS domain S-box-containing protein
VVATVKSLLRTHHAEEVARTAARRWQTTFDAIHDAVWVLDRDGRVLRCNRAMAVLLGRPGPALEGRPYRELLREAFGPAAEPLTAVLEASPSVQVPELPLGARWFRVSSDPVPGEAGEPAGRVHLLADITRHKALESQLIQSQKMEAIGRLAGGVAHDFNNLLTIITGNLALLLGTTPNGDPRREVLLNTEKAGWRAVQLTRQLLDFARQTPLTLVPTDLNACVAETLDLLGSALERGIQVEVQGAPDLWPILADPGQINQVLMNLCLNARDAMPEGGRLIVATDNLVLSGEADRTPPQGGRPGEFVRVRVRDTGHGIPADIQPRIFDPFFTTKDYGRGTGLGLAVVFGIVQQHHGWIECSSAPNEGACFDVYLPRHV